MLTCGTLILLVNVCLFLLSILCGYKYIIALSFIFVIISSFYNLKSQILSLCAGYCTSLVSSIKEKFEENCVNLSDQKSLSYFCSTPRMQGNNSSGIFKSDSMFSPIPKSDRFAHSNGLNTNVSPKLQKSTLGMGRLSRYSLSEDLSLPNTSTSKMKPVDTSPQLRSRAAGIKTTQTVAGPLLATTRHKIDSHLYTDVNSPGLTTRIVHYNEVNRDEKVTMEPRYKGFGQLPIVNLNRGQPRQIPLKRPSVKIRIAPPDVSSYATDHRMHMLTTEQHRPLLPSPIQESTGSPTKSVLEALKEISRKRIHSQDNTEYYSDDISKRQRKESLTRGAMGPNPFTRPPISKRPRDEEPRDYMDTPLFRRQLINENNYKCWRPKKRQRNETVKCNDILSSLSSSRHLQRENSKRKAEMSPKDETKQVKLTMQNVTHISISSNDTEQRSSDVLKISENEVEDQHVKHTTDSPANIIQPKETPKITLFNKVFPKMVKSTHDSEINDDDYDRNLKMSFVKPRKESVSSSSGSLSYTEKCKLSQMLGCLSDTNNADEFSSNTIPNTIEADKVNTLDTKVASTSAFTTESCVKPISMPKEANTSNITSKATDVNTVTKINTIAPITSGIVSAASSNPQTSPSVSKESPLKPLAAIFGHTSPILNSTGSISASNNTNKSSTTTGFSIPSSNHFTTPSKIGTTTSPSVSSSAPLFGLSTTQSPSLSTNADFKPSSTTAQQSNLPKENVPGGFQFDLKKVTSNDTSSTKQNAVFGASQASKTNTSAENAKILNGPSFENIGNVKSSAANPSPMFGSATTQNSSLFGSANTTLFGSPTVKSSNENDSKLPTATTTSSSFSLNSVNTTTAPFVFGNTSTTFASSSAIKSPVTSSNPSNNPVFGVQSTAAPAFGLQTTFNTTSSLPMFGSNKTNTTSNDTKDVTTAGATVSSTFGTSTNATSLFASGATTTTASSGFSFAASNAANSKSLFPSAATTSNSTLFGASITTTTSAAVPGANSAATTLNFGSKTTQPSIFGSAAPNSSPFASSISGSSMFGATVTTTSSINTPNSSSIFGTANKSAPTFGSSTSSFGAPVTTAPLPSFGAPVTTQSAFGSSVPSTTSAFGAKNTSAPTFGIPTTTTPSFGAATTSTPFGSNTTPNPPAFQLNSTTPAFGAVATSSNANTTSTFGALSNSTNLLGTGSTSAFGAKTTFATPATTANVFGNAAQSTAFGTSNPAAEKSVFTFGSSATQSSTPFNFGSQSSASKTFNFNATTPSFGANATTPSFGANAAAPSFGANAAAPSFGANSAAPSFGANSATPNFGSNTTTPSFGVNATLPSFGANATTPSFGTNTATPSFGGSSAAPSFGASATSPSFGTSTQLNSSFGASAPSGSFNSPGPAFGANPSGNMFSIGAGGSSKSRMRNRRQR